MRPLDCDRRDGSVEEIPTCRWPHKHAATRGSSPRSRFCRERKDRVRRDYFLGGSRSAAPHAVQTRTPRRRSTDSAPTMPSMPSRPGHSKWTRTPGATALPCPWIFSHTSRCSIWEEHSGQRNSILLGRRGRNETPTVASGLGPAPSISTSSSQTHRYRSVRGSSHSEMTSSQRCTWWPNARRSATIHSSSMCVFFAALKRAVSASPSREQSVWRSAPDSKIDLEKDSSSIVREVYPKASEPSGRRLASNIFERHFFKDSIPHSRRALPTEIRLRMV